MKKKFNNLKKSDIIKIVKEKNSKFWLCNKYDLNEPEKIEILKFKGSTCSQLYYEYCKIFNMFPLMLHLQDNLIFKNIKDAKKYCNSRNIKLLKNEIEKTEILLNSLKEKLKNEE